MFELKSREVTISKLEVEGEIRREANHIDLDIIVDCSSGTYIRAIARDLGSALGVGGHLTELRRTRIGKFNVEDAMQFDSGVTPLPVMPAVEAVKHILPTLEITPKEAIFIRQGKRITGEASELTALTSQNNLVAVAEPAGKQIIKSVVVFNDEVAND